MSNFVIEHTLQELIDDCTNGYGDWHEVFKYATPDPVLGSSAPHGAYTVDDVEEIIALVDGEGDCTDWVGVFKLKDGRYVSLSAGCDYTGWG